VEDPEALPASRSAAKQGEGGEEQLAHANSDLQSGD
jgi:hypothetical protein